MRGLVGRLEAPQRRPDPGQAEARPSGLPEDPAGGAPAFRAVAHPRGERLHPGIAGPAGRLAVTAPKE